MAAKRVNRPREHKLIVDIATGQLAYKPENGKSIAATNGAA